MFPDVRQIIDYFVRNGKYIESCKFSADLCSTCVKVDGNGKCSGKDYCLP